MAVSRHEAAHVLTALHLGRELGSVDADGLAIVGLIRDDVKPDQVWLDQVLGDLMILLAGAEVDRRTLGPTHTDGSQHDRERAERVARRFTATPDEATALLELAWAKTRTICSMNGFAEAGERLAEQLVEAGRLNAQEIENVISEYEKKSDGEG